jgi:thiol:disulfide interchange protein DsbC
LRISVLKAVLILLVCAGAAYAGLSSNDSPQQILAKKFPKLKVDSMSPAPEPGLYEVISGDNVFYFDPKTSLIIFGEIWDSSGKSLTAKARSKIAGGKHELFVKAFPSAIKIGSGKHEVIEIIDPDCPYCRKMTDFWNTRTDVTRYVFLLPLSSIHPQSKGKVEYILSSPNMAKSLESVLAGKYDHNPIPEYKRNVDRITAISDVLSRSHITGTPAYFVDGQFLSGANTTTITAMLENTK